MADETPRYGFQVPTATTVNTDDGPVRLTPDQPFTDEDPCRVLEVMGAWRSQREAQGEEAAVTEEIEGLIDHMIEACVGQYLQALEEVEIGIDGLSLGEDDNSGLADLDGAPPQDSETPQTTGVPDPAPEAGVTGVPDSSTRTPGERAHDPRNPVSPDQLADEAKSDGASPAEADAVAERARRNDPEPGEPHSEFSRSRRPELDGTNDPVAIFSGAFELVLTDAEIASPGMPLVFRRTYHSGRVRFGPLGFNWDHNYNVYLRPISGGGAAIWTGSLREELYLPDADGPPGSFDPPHGIFRRLTHTPASIADPETWTLEERLGTTLEFHRPADWPEPERVPLVEIADRNGNRHSLSYSAEGHLEQVEDADGRFLRFFYGDCGLLEALEDHTGRRWQYLHDDMAEHLCDVVSPPTDEYPDGRRFHYDYDDHAGHPALRHNIVAITDPDDSLVVTNTYGHDPGTDDFNRVIRQEFGDFVSYFEAERLQAVRPRPNNINAPALRVNVIDPGYLYIYTFNYRGDILDKRFRLAADGSYRMVAETFRYDPQGNLITHFRPDGSGMGFVYDHDNGDPRAR